MARFDPVPDLAVDDQVDETYVDAVTKMLNYMGIGGANIVSSATIAISSRYGPRPPWHDIQLLVRGPTISDLECTFRERWEDPTPLDHRNPWRRAIRVFVGQPRRPDALPRQDAAPAPCGTHAVQVVRTYPAKRPARYAK